MVIRLLVTALLIVFAAFPSWAILRGSGVPTSPTITLSGELCRLFLTSSSLSRVLTIPSGVSIAAGERAVLLLGIHATGQTITSVADSVGNTYTIDKNYVYNNVTTLIASSVLSSPIAAGDTITVTVGTTTYSTVVLFMHKITGETSGVEGAAPEAGAYSALMSIPGTTTHDNAVLVGLVQDGGVTGADWDYGAGMTYSKVFTPIYKYAPTAGTYNPNCTVAATTSWGGAWVAYY